jgi:hypothetical protein
MYATTRYNFVRLKATHKISPLEELVVGNHNRHIHPKTVRNRLREFGLRARRPYIGLPLTRARRTCRKAWLAAHGSRQFPKSNLLLPLTFH